MSAPKQQKAETRARILHAAGSLFREHGVDAVGVDAVMHAAGLTHGGFYAHFRNKEALVAEVSAALLEKSADRWAEISESGDKSAALARIVGPYLDPAHIAAGHRCPLPTLGPDVARRAPTKTAMAGALRRMVAALTRVLPGRSRALVALSTMVGAVVLARLADDPDFAEEILRAAAASIVPATRSAHRGT